MPQTRIAGFLDYTIGNTLVLIRTFSAQTDTFTKFVHEPERVISALATDVAISFCDVTTAGVIFIETDKQISVKLDATTNTPTVVNSIYLATTPATALFISNANITDANLKITIIGT